MRSQRLARVVEAEAELAVGLAGRDRGVGVAGDVGRDADLDGLGLGAVAEPLELLDVVEVVDDDVADAGLERLADLVVGLRVAVQVDALGVEAGLQRERELSAARHVAAVALLGEEPQHRGGGERLGREDELDVVVEGLERLLQVARALRAGRPRRRRRAGCRRSRRARRTSQPPTCRRPRSSRYEPRG